MANLTVYANEPATHGKVVLHTSIGPLDVELWSKQAPIACRNFIQLCLENYYDGCIFHRVIKGFMAQTGDPTGTGNGGESVFGSTFKDEFHGRLRFTHRGLLGMASNGPNTNGSQFFITLDRCEWLDNKHTIFGKVTGNSLYNLPRFDELETDEKDRPTFPPRIQRTEVLLEPFDDIVPRAQEVVQEEAPKKKKKKEKKNLSLLSFGEEAAAEEEVLQKVNTKLKSSHDVLEDPRLSREQAVAREELEMKQRSAAQEAGKKAAARDALASASMNRNGEGDDVAFADRMRQQMLERQRRLQQDQHAVEKAVPQGTAGDAQQVQQPRSHTSTHSLPKEDVREEYEKLKRELAAPSKNGQPVEGARNYKWRGKGAKDSDDEDSGGDSDPETRGMSELERQRAKYLKRKKESAGLTREQRQKATMQKLKGFQKSLEEDGSDWKAHHLKFERERREAESASVYDSFDPLKHGADDERARTKIKARENTMLSMARAGGGGTFDTSGWDE
ncbi:hypothetical protein AB1Y20_010800 [Prymnesium parvum]|uniref:PPIase cyclophilin-type domain-containing protein n=1 Tax=Prymnesium parvum TaxID=97485 RepID=A0AB34IRT2_PRYPA